MQEWVSTLRSKLREMKIISPKENLYSRLPEIKQPLLPTRDPMSPLPAPPPVPAAIVPGIEPLTLHGNAIASSSPPPLTGIENTSESLTANNEITPASNLIPPQSPPCSAMSNTLTQNLLNMLSDPIVNLTNRLAAEDEDGDGEEEEVSFLNRPSTSADRSNRQQDLAIDSDASSSASSSLSSSLARTFTTNVLNSEQKLSMAEKQKQRKVINREDSTGSSGSSTDSFKSFGEIQPIVIPRPQRTGGTTVETPAVVEQKDTTINSTTDDSLNGNQLSTTNITIIQLSDEPVVGSSSASGSGGESRSIEDNTFKANIEVNNETTATKQTVRVTSPKLINATAGVTAATPSTTTTTNGGYDEIRNLETGVTNISVGAILIQSTTTTTSATGNNLGASGAATANNSRSNNYEQVFLSDTNNNSGNPQPTTPRAPAVAPQPMPYSVFLLSRQPRSASHVELTAPQRNQVQINGPVDNNNTSLTTIESPPATQEAATDNNVNSHQPSTSRPRNKSSSENPNIETNAARNSRQRRIVAQDSRKRSSSSSGDHRAATTNTHNNGNGHQIHHHNHANGQSRIVSPQRQHPPLPRPANQRVSLREQQVLQLRREISHPGGVRLQLRKKDCLGSIALVDAFNSVWVAGWKQKDHPMLYNALHIGDRLVSVAGIPVTGGVTNAGEVNKIIRATQSVYIELIVRRVPFGRVYAIKRDMDGQCLGLIRESNSATIVDIIPNGLAARHKLPVKAKSCDGMSLTFWVLTEINGRPLNMFFKENEVQDRLNAVGKEISILVQPLDLITKLKKQLKSMRSYKDYIVQ